MRSFSGATKEELYRIENTKRCCNRAEYAGMLLFGAAIAKNSIRFTTENQDVLSNYVRLSREFFIEPVVYRSKEGSARYVAENTDCTMVLKTLIDLRLFDTSTGEICNRAPGDLIENECCRRAFIKGAFLSGGTVIDPRKNYNLEIVASYEDLCRDLQKLTNDSGFDFKYIVRKNKYVLYLKNSESISDFLTFMGAYKAQMELLNIKIEKEIRNDFNRAANSETANLEKTINASVQQVKAIEEIERTTGIENLPEDLKEIAYLRLKYKGLSLSELGAKTNPPLSKSGVNHRMKKLLNMV